VSAGKNAPAQQAPVDSARRVIAIEASALQAMVGRLDEAFTRAVDIVTAARGRTVVTGMGKSGQICRKIAATLSSTGTSALFLHAAEAAHGDLGMFARGDVCLAVSNSGTTKELVGLLPAIKRLQIPIVAITGGVRSPLAEAADVVLDASVDQEACPLGLAPTASTTAMLAMGDALAVAVLERKGFSEDDFALLHPGGALGRRLLRVRDLMHTGVQLPRVEPERGVRDTLQVMTDGHMGIVAVVDAAGALVGVITDGDIRRGVLRYPDASERTAADLMSTSPKTVAADALAASALALMEQHSITSLFIVDGAARKPIGLIHLHDLLRAGVA